MPRRSNFLVLRGSGLTVGHVESGLRSFRLFHPFPEEITRLLTFRLSQVLFCPGEWAMGNVAKLRREKINTGSNTLGDTLALAIATERSREHVPSGPYGLVSLHRYENIFSRQSFEALITLVEEIATAREDGPLLLFVLHPPTARQLERFGLEERLRGNPKIELRPRCTYFDFVTLIEGADFVVTDGGSIQEESSYLGIPCLLMREATERQEGLGANVLLSELAPERIREFGRDPSRWRRPRHLPGNRPSDCIADAAVHFANRAPRRDAPQ